MITRSYLSYRNLGFIALILGALSHAQAQNSSAAALINRTDRNFRVDVSRFALYQYDPAAPATPKAIEGGNPELDGRNVNARARALRLGPGAPVLTSAVLRPGEILEFTGRAGFNTLQTVDLTIREASAAGPGAAGFFLYWTWETEILPQGMVTSGGARGINPAGPATFSLENYPNGRVVAIVPGPPKPAGPMSGLPETKDLLPEPEGLLPEPMGHAERNLPPGMVKILDDKNGDSSSSTSSTSTATSSSSSSSSSSSTSQAGHAVPPGGL